MILPPALWGLWLARFVALEACLLAALTGAGALLLGLGPIEQGLAVAGIVAGLLPALAAVPAYVREGQPFSILAWLGGGRRAEGPVERDLVLAPGLLADLYRAPGAGPHPFVVVVHGGSWRSGDKGDAAHVSRALARAGFSVIDVRYRLAPEHRFPAAVEDVKCMLGQVCARAAELGIDPGRGALLGRSAGAQIALIAAYSGPEIAPAFGAPEARVRAVVSIYGPTDLAWCHANPFFPDVVKGTEALEQYLGGTPAEAPEAYRLATPQSWVGGALPPTLIVHGTAERCVRLDNAERLRDALTARGHSVRTLLVPWADHGFDVRAGGLGEQLTRGVLIDFLKQHLS